MNWPYPDRTCQSSPIGHWSLTARHSEFRLQKSSGLRITGRLTRITATASGSCQTGDDLKSATPTFRTPDGTNVLPRTSLDTLIGNMSCLFGVGIFNFICFETIIEKFMVFLNSCTDSLEIETLLSICLFLQFLLKSTHPTSYQIRKLYWITW